MVSFESCQFLSFLLARRHVLSVFLSTSVFVSLFKYFELVKDKAKSKCSDERSIALSLSNKDKNRVSRDKLITISEELQYINDNNKTAKSR